MRHIILLLVALSLGTPEAQETLRTLVRQHGHVTQAIQNEYPPATFGELVKHSNLVARVVVIKERAVLSPDETTVSTRYTAQLLDVMHARGRAPVTGGNIEIDRLGGTIILEGKTVNVYESDFPNFELGDEYILFLGGSGGQVYDVPAGGQGAFKVVGGLAQQVSRNNAVIRQQIPQLSLERLRAEVTAAASRK
ncbi:MAG TPA: hypothetical protein VFK57_08020 [Vicinamibacterales bacterium]|nr:hypothetical protein [Vicinamibacterales bacterium]